MKIKELFFSLGQNITDIITIVIAAVIFVNYQTINSQTNSTNILLNAILGVMVMIAVSGLFDRVFKLNRIEKALNDLKNTSKSNFKASDFFMNHDLTEEFFKNSEEIFISGILLSTTSRKYMQILSEQVTNGSKLRVIIVDPKSSAVKECMVARSPGKTDHKFWEDKLSNTINIFNIIADVQNPNKDVKIGFLPFIPSFGIIIVKKKDHSYKCYVELYHHLSGEKNAKFVVEKSGDLFWYAFFESQFNKMWEVSRKEDL